jgi:hypothetical protein
MFMKDGASSHIEQQVEPESVAAATTGNWNITMVRQPAQYSNTYQLDLSFFRALQSTQWDHDFASEIDGLIEQVTLAYTYFPPR